MVEGNVKTTELIASIYEELNKTPTSNWYKERETAEEETVIIFMSSLEEIADKYLEEQGTSKGLLKDINRIWLTINKIYPDCFLDGKINKDYNIQKTLGIRVLHRLFLDCYTTTFEEGLEEFEYVLALSNVVESSWLTGKEISNIYFYGGVDGVVNKIKEGCINMKMNIS